MVKQITALELKDYSEKQDQYLIDVRTPEEWETIGRPDGEALGLKTYFVAYQFQKDDGRVLNTNFEKEMDDLCLDKSKKIFFICRSGQRSQKAAEIFEKKGFETFNVSDGFLRSDTQYESSWKADNLPIK
jgi:rhodanese-related sulfurtransferase